MVHNNNDHQFMPCPFCGEDKNISVVIRRNPSGSKNKVICVKCYHCHAQGPVLYGNSVTVFSKEEEAIELWNNQRVHLRADESLDISDEIKKESFIHKIIFFFKHIFKTQQSKEDYKEDIKDETNEQLKLFHSIEIGDVVYAKMPLSDEALSHIDEQHRERPYVVVEKSDDKVIAYQCTGNMYSWQKNYETYFFDKDIYDNGKHGYIQLHAIYELPVDHLRFKYKKLYPLTLQKLNKRIMISRYFKNNLPLFSNEIPLVEKGDMLIKDDHIYYVYHRHDDMIYVNTVYNSIDNEDDHSYYHLVLEDLDYYVSFSEKSEFSIHDQYYFINIVPDEKIVSIERAKQFYKKKKKEQRKKEQELLPVNYVLKYPIGQTFYLGMDDYLYLYHLGKTMYALEMIDGSYDYIPMMMKTEEHLGRGKCLNKDVVLAIYMKVIKRGYDKHQVLKSIIDELYVKQ